MDNANPTILTAAQLPTRQSKATKAVVQGPVSQLSELIMRKPKYLSEPFCDVSWHDIREKDNDFTEEPIDEQEIYDLISTISDPEHPISLGQLAVVNLPDIQITPSPSAHSDPDTLITVLVKITPTITHCSLATVIGLGVRVRLEQALPPNYRVDVVIKEGAHSQDDQVNKQLADKERVAAALENDNLKGMLDAMLATCE
ncbi:FAM96B protein [Pseudomassariella vexata]|uniref:FAM96B protein n=1 Tax=Pseudomassariella vexata TaxID=1141098 RepID=A0A1Y2DD29_9PEZI|nr:FAM96B protein [Pseudomassariella vexata]ORY57170.1 FAM96B protein [Pseudomassariella vexata]